MCDVRCSWEHWESCGRGRRCGAVLTQVSCPRIAPASIQNPTKLCMRVPRCCRGKAGHTQAVTETGKNHETLAQRTEEKVTGDMRSCYACVTSLKPCLHSTPHHFVLTSMRKIQKYSSLELCCRSPATRAVRENLSHYGQCLAVQNVSPNAPMAFTYGRRLFYTTSCLMLIEAILVADQSSWQKGCLLLDQGVGGRQRR
jgi:hypothetical protein